MSFKTQVTTDGNVSVLKDMDVLQDTSLPHPTSIENDLFIV